MLYLRQDKLDEAEALFKYVVALHRQPRSLLGEANNVQNLRKVYSPQDKLHEAEADEAEFRIRQTIILCPSSLYSFSHFLSSMPIIMPLSLECPSKYKDSSSDSESLHVWHQRYNNQTHMMQYAESPMRAATMTRMSIFPPPSLSNFISVSAAYNSQECNQAP